MKSTLSLLAPIALAFGAVATPALAGGPHFGIQDDYTFSVATTCENGEASTFIDVFFNYLRSPGETGGIGWKVSIYEKDTQSADDLIVVKTGSFGPLTDGGHILETARPTFLFDSCPIISGDEDGNACAEYYAVIEITFTNGADPGSVQTVTTGVQNSCCEQCIALAIDLLSFQPTYTGSTVVVDWTTASETDNAGFRVSRSATPWGPWTILNEGLIPAQGTPSQGMSYTFVDTNPTIRRPFYRLEDIDILGNVTAHEAVFASNWPAVARFWLQYAPIAF